MKAELLLRTEQTKPDSCTIYVGGNLDMTTCDELLHLFETKMQLGFLHFCVDLSGIEYISSAGFGVFIEAMAVSKERGGTIRFTNPSPKARDIFKLIGVMLNSCDFE